MDEEPERTKIYQERCASGSESFPPRQFTFVISHQISNGNFAQILQTARGIEYLHSQSYVHGNLKGVRSLFMLNAQWIKIFLDQRSH